MDDRKIKQTAILLKALRLALSDVEEHRLYKSGKLDGLFTGRVGLPGIAAARSGAARRLPRAGPHGIQRQIQHRMGAPDAKGGRIHLPERFGPRPSWTNCIP